MNIDWVIPCRYAEVHDNLATIVGAGIDTYWVPDLPAQLQVVMAVKLLGMADELDESIKHAVTNRVRDPAGNVLTEAKGELAVGVEAAREDWLTGITLPAVATFEVAAEGTYMIEVEVDDASHSIPIHVVHGLPPGAVTPE